MRAAAAHAAEAARRRVAVARMLQPLRARLALRPRGVRRGPNEFEAIRGEGRLPAQQQRERERRMAVAERMSISSPGEKLTLSATIVSPFAHPFLAISFCSAT